MILISRKNSLPLSALLAYSTLCIRVCSRSEKCPVRCRADHRSLWSGWVSETEKTSLKQCSDLTLTGKPRCICWMDNTRTRIENGGLSVSWQLLCGVGRSIHRCVIKGYCSAVKCSVHLSLYILFFLRYNLA